MIYKHYEADVEFDENAGVFHGEVVNTPRDVITFEGSSVDELTQAFRDSVDDYLELCASRNEQPEQPVSSSLQVTVPPAVGRKIMLEAKHQGKTVDAFISEAFHLKTMTSGHGENY
jgi:predicted HicB family RNase H-like nuclease